MQMMDIVSFGSDETLGTEKSDTWFGNMLESNNFDGLGGDDELIGGWVNDVLSGGSGMIELVVLWALMF